MILAYLFIAGFSNAVNLTDGLDGLAAGSSAMVFASYVFISFWQFTHDCANELIEGCYTVRDPLDVTLVAAAGLGACLGFLWWNTSPARIFMGDTGSLALGGLLSGLAIVTRTELLLVVTGGLFVAVTLSVVIQVAFFRATRRRVFRMAPLHHHFELAGLDGEHGDRPVLAGHRHGGRLRDRAVLRRLAQLRGAVSRRARPDRRAPCSSPGSASPARPPPGCCSTAARGCCSPTPPSRRSWRELVGGRRRVARRARASVPAGVDLVVTSPGWRPDAPLLVDAARRGVEVVGEPELAWRLRAGADDGRPRPGWPSPAPTARRRR